MTRKRKKSLLLLTLTQHQPRKKQRKAPLQILRQTKRKTQPRKTKKKKVIRKMMRKTKKKRHQKTRKIQQMILQLRKMMTKKKKVGKMKLKLQRKRAAKKLRKVTTVVPRRMTRPRLRRSRPRPWRLRSIWSSLRISPTCTVNGWPKRNCWKAISVFPIRYFFGSWLGLEFLVWLVIIRGVMYLLHIMWAMHGKNKCGREGINMIFRAS